MPTSSPVLALLGAAALTTAARAQPPRAQAPEGAPTRDLFDDAVFTAGAATFLGSYGLSLGFAATSLERENRWLYLPLAGPWIALGDNNDTGDGWLLAFDGIAQAAGVALLATAVIREHRERRVGLRYARVAVTPRSVGVVGRF